MLHNAVTEKIIRAFYKVYNKLGYGFLEKVYENAMVFELDNIGCEVVQQKKLQVYYREQVVGDYFADLLVDDSVIVELKAYESLNKWHDAQLINYLKASKIEVGLLLNFGKKAEFTRRVLSAK